MRHPRFALRPSEPNSIQVTEEFKAVGSVVVTQGAVRLTADRAALHKLSGRLTAAGHVHLKDPVHDVWAEELTINVNTESVLVVNGKIFLKETGTWLRGRLLRTVVRNPLSRKGRDIYELRSG